MRTLALALLVGLAGCVPLSEHPAGEEQSAVFDARLQGAWRAVGGDAPFFVFVGSADESRRGVRLVTVEETNDGRWKQDEYTGISTRRGAHGFLSVRYETSGGERRGWVIARYALTRGGQLQVSTLDEKRLAAVVRAGKIAGRVSGEGPNLEIDLTASGASLLTFLDSAEGGRLFGAPHALVRATAHQSMGAGVAPTPSR